jgi:hypothetical protein
MQGIFGSHMEETEIWGRGTFLFGCISLIWNIFEEKSFVQDGLHEIWVLIWTFL